MFGMFGSKLDPVEEAERQALRQLKAAFEEAVCNNDMELLRPYLHPDFTFVTFTDREFNDFRKFKQRWESTRRKLIGRGSYTVELLPDRTQFAGDIAICKGDSRNTIVMENGKMMRFTAKWTAVCQKVEGEWLILRAHNSLDPFGNPMVKSGVKRLACWSSFLGVVLGGYLGWKAKEFTGGSPDAEC